MTKDVDHFLKCLSAILDSSVESSLFRSVLHVFIGLCDLLVSNFLSSLYILEIRPLSDVELVKIFSHSVSCRFVLLTVSFALQKLFSFRRSHLLIVSFSVCAAEYPSFLVVLGDPCERVVHSRRGPDPQVESLCLSHHMDVGNPGFL